MQASLWAAADAPPQLGSTWAPTSVCGSFSSFYVRVYDPEPHTLHDVVCRLQAAEERGEIYRERGWMKKAKLDEINVVIP